MVEVPKHVKIGKNAQIDENVVLGIGKESWGDLIIGDNAVIRSGSVIYRGNVIGNDFQTGHNVIIRNENKIGDNVIINSSSVINPGNKIGNNCRIHSLCFLEETTIEDSVFLAPGVKTADDIHPICPLYEQCVSGPHIEKAASIGANVVINPGITIGKYSLIGSGSVVIKSIPEYSVAAGNPAKVIKKVGELKCVKGLFEKPYCWDKEELMRIWGNKEEMKKFIEKYKK